MRESKQERENMNMHILEVELLTFTHIYTPLQSQHHRPGESCQEYS